MIMVVVMVMITMSIERVYVSKLQLKAYCSTFSCYFSMENYGEMIQAGLVGL
jgi:hypothetical protein